MQAGATHDLATSRAKPRPFGQIAATSSANSLCHVFILSDRVCSAFDYLCIAPLALCARAHFVPVAWTEAATNGVLLYLFAGRCLILRASQPSSIIALLRNHQFAIRPDRLAI